MAQYLRLLPEDFTALGLLAEVADQQERELEACRLMERVHINPDAIARDINPFDHGSVLYTDVTKTEGLKQALDQHRFDGVFGRARRDE